MCLMGPPPTRSERQGVARPARRAPSWGPPSWALHPGPPDWAGAALLTQGGGHEGPLAAGDSHHVCHSGARVSRGKRRENTTFGFPKAAQCGHEWPRRKPRVATNVVQSGTERHDLSGSWPPSVTSGHEWRVANLATLRGIPRRRKRQPRPRLPPRQGRARGRLGKYGQARSPKRYGLAIRSAIGVPNRVPGREIPASS